MALVAEWFHETCRQFLFLQELDNLCGTRSARGWIGTSHKLAALGVLVHHNMISPQVLALNKGRTAFFQAILDQEGHIWHPSPRLFFLVGHAGHPATLDKISAILEFDLCENGWGVANGAHNTSILVKRADEFLRRNIFWKADERSLSAGLENNPVLRRRKLDGRQCRCFIQHLVDLAVVQKLETG